MVADTPLGAFGVEATDLGVASEPELGSGYNAPPPPPETIIDVDAEEIASRGYNPPPPPPPEEE